MKKHVPSIVAWRMAAAAALACATAGTALGDDAQPPAEPQAPAAAPPAETSPEMPEYSPGEGEENAAAMESSIATPRRGIFTLGPVERPIEAVKKLTDRLAEDTGLRLRLAYTTVFQQATGGPGDRTRFSGDLDLMSSWTLLGRGTPNTGTLFASAEYRHQIGWEAPNSLRDDLGTLQRTTGGFDDRGWAVRDLYWVQRLFDDRLRLAVGRADVSDFVGSHRLQGINGSFSNRAFSADSTTAYPGGHVMAAGASIRPVPWFYATGGIANGYGRSTISDLPFLDEGKFFGFGEVGFTPTIEGLGAGRYALLLWHMDERELINSPDDWGFTIILEQSLSEKLHVFARHGRAEDGFITGLKRSTQGGLGYTGLLGSPDDLTAIAFGITEPARDGSDEKVIEAFHRFQLSTHTQLSFGGQVIFDPTNAPDDDVLGVLTCRFRVAF